LAHIQLAKLKELLLKANSTNAFYRRAFMGCGFDPKGFRGFSDLAKLPVLGKEQIRNELVHHLSEGFERDKTVHKRTGGSTGVPIHIYMDFEAASFKKAAAERHDGWAKRAPGDSIGAVWGDTDGPQPWRTRLRSALTDRAFYLDTLKFDQEHIEAFLARLVKIRPPVLMGHAHSVFRLAEYVRDHGISRISFDGIITTAMVLTDVERKVIEEVFQSPVFNRYGCEELSIIASECEEHTGMHIFSEGLYLECLGDDSSVPRKLIITDLANVAMPLIRYEIGDCGILATGQCPCGRGLPRLLEVSGRTADFLYNPDGVPIFGISILDTFVIHIPGFKQVQIVQDKYDHLVFYVVRDEACSEESLSLLRKNVREIFGSRMRYDVTFVDKVELTAGGKYRFSICTIDGARS
jgi:phenylacetate-CoA ligase